MAISANITQPVNHGPTTSIVEYVPSSESSYKFAGPPSLSTTSGPYNPILLIEELRKLEDGWDGYGALPLTAESCTHASAFLSAVPPGVPAPEISPTSNGTIAMEWQSNGGEAYVDIGRTRYSGHIQPRHGTPIFIEGHLASSMEERFAAEQIFAVIQQLLYGTFGRRSFARSIQITEPTL